MKKIVWTLFFIIACNMKVVAQVYEHPVFERSDIPAFHITKVSITKDTTYIFCLLYEESGSWASISKDTYLRDSKSLKTFPIQRCVGLPYSPEERIFSQDESCELLFCFPSIAGIEQFDFIESEGESGFNIYGVNLKKNFKISYTDTELKRISEKVLAYDSSSDIENTMLLKDYATSLNNLVSYNVSMGNHAEAIRLGLVDVEIRKIIFGEEHQGYIEPLSKLAEYYAVLGNYDEAIRVETEVAKAKKKVFGPEDQNYINSLENLVSYYRGLQNFTEATRLQKDVTNLKKKSLGAGHIEYAYSLINLATCYSEFGNNKEALLIGTEAVEILKRIVGTDAPSYTSALSNLSYYNFEIGNYGEAIRIEKEVIEILKRNVGIDSLEYAISLNRLSKYYTRIGNFNDALQIGTEAIGIIKRIIGTDNSDYSNSLSNLARLNSELGNYIESIRLETEALDIDKRIFGKEHPAYATSLNDLAGYYQDIGNYGEAFRLLSETKDIYKRIYGAESVDYAILLNNLADYYSKVGNYSDAIRFGIEAMELYKRLLGTEHYLYAISLINLTNYNTSINNYPEAIRFGSEAVKLYKNVLGTNHPNYAASLNNLAIVNSKVGNYSEAMRLGTEAMEFYKRVLGTEHPDYARSLNSLAWYNLKSGHYDEAIRLGLEAMEIRKKVLGIEHPLYATSLLNLAIYNARNNNYNEAIRLGSEATAILETSFGTEHPFYLTSLDNLARYYLEQGKYLEAYNSLQLCLINSQSIVLRNFTNLSSHNQKNMWVGEYAYRFNTVFPNIVSKYQTKQSVSELYNKTCLFAKSLLLNTSLEMRKLLLESRDSVIIDNYEALSSNISLYNKQLEKQIKERSIDVDSLSRVIEQQEMELARESKIYGDYTHNLVISWKDVQSRLGDNDIAIEFLDFPVFNTDSIMYVALTLKKDYDNPHMVTLFQADQLNAIPKDDYYTQTNVSNLVWKPLEEELSGVKNIYFAPSGELHRIGIEYLPISKTENISDVYTLHRLSSTRQLAAIQDETEGKNNILYGGLDYDEKSDAISTDSTSTKEPILRSTFSRANVDSLSLRSSFEYLEGTKKEADMISEEMKQHRVPYIYYSGIDGTEESFKKQEGSRPKLMHIATHGFFLTEEEAEKSRFARPEIELISEGFQSVGRPIEDKSMTRSGLLFSGCNHAIHHEQIPDGEEDGILTAQEISTLDLRGLDLVVLSACQTGLGDIISGEGVFGLQRGFKKAGAKTILMSLDKVDDEATRILMVEFYRNLMNGKTKRQSLQEAQQYLRKVDNGKYDDPKYWTSFIMLDGLK